MNQLNKSDLSQFIQLKMEIKYQEEKLRFLKEQTVNCSQNNDGLPHSCDYENRIAKIVSEIIDTQILLELNIQECLNELNKVEQYIQSIDDSLIRQIMRFRYLEGMTWQKIAFEIGKYDESYPRKKHDKYLKFSEKSESEMLK